jgi:ketosteroid isomerase-like protein
MSAEDIEILRGLYEEWGRGDYTRSDVFSQDVVMSVDENFPDIMIEPGYEGLLAVLKMWLSSWEKPFIVEADEFIDLGEYVVVTVHWHGVSTLTGSTVERPGAHLWKLRDGKAVTFKICRDRAEAFASAAATPS